MEVTNATESYVKQKTMHENRSQKTKSKSKIKVVFAKSFSRKPKLKIDIASSGVDFKITAHSKNGFTIEFFDFNEVALSYNGRWEYEAKPLNLD